jgi:hypothetical protein
MKYEVTFAVVDTDEKGNDKKMKPLYLVEAYSPIEAITKATEAIAQFYAENECLSCKKVNYADVFTGEDEEDKFYRVKENIIIIDERTGAEKRTPLVSIFQASDINDAKTRLEVENKKSLADRETVSISETKIIDFIA